VAAGFVAQCATSYTPPPTRRSPEPSNVHPIVLLDGVSALLAAKDHINVFIYDPIAPDPEGHYQSGAWQSDHRAIQIHQGSHQPACSSPGTEAVVARQPGRR